MNPTNDIPLVPDRLLTRNDRADWADWMEDVVSDTNYNCLLCVRGETLTLQQWAARCGINISFIARRWGRYRYSKHFNVHSDSTGNIEYIFRGTTLREVPAEEE